MSPLLRWTPDPLRSLLTILMLVSPSAYSAAAAPERVEGIEPGLFRIEKTSYEARDTRYLAILDARLGPGLMGPGTSLLLNEKQPLKVVDDRVQIEVSLHPGPNSVSLTRVDIHGEKKQWGVTLQPPPDWPISPQCADSRARWEDLQAPVSTHFEVSCQTDPGGGAVKLLLVGVDAKHVLIASGLEMSRALTLNSQLPAWETSTGAIGRVEIPLSFEFTGPDGPLKAQGKLVLRPTLPFALTYQAAAGMSFINSSEATLSHASFAPRLSFAALSPVFWGRLDASAEAGLDTLQLSLRANLRFPVFAPATQPGWAPFLDLVYLLDNQYSGQNPMAAKPISVPLLGGGLEKQVSPRVSVALAGHIGWLSPTSNWIGTPTSSLAWDAGAWASWLTAPADGTLWFLRARYFYTTLTLPAFSGMWSTGSLEIGWGGKSGPSKTGGLGVGI